jgi:hypothetical protein
MVSVQSYKGLSTLLYALSVIEAIGSLVLIFGSNWVLSMAPANLTPPDHSFVTIFMKGIGIFALGVAYLLCVTARDPARHVAVIDTLVFFLIASAALIWYALAALHLGQYFPANYIVVRIAVQVIVAIVLVVMRPKAVARA